MTPVSVVWFWRGLKGHSVTFAALFAALVLGASIPDGVHRLLAALGVHWLYVLILPVLLFGWMARQEARWFADERKRKRIARTLLLGSLTLAVLLAWLRPEKKEGETGAGPANFPAARPPP